MQILSGFFCEIINYRRIIAGNGEKAMGSFSSGLNIIRYSSVKLS